MAINGCAVRDVYESFVGKGSGGRRQFVDWFRHGLGIADENGNPYRDVVKGRNVLESSKRRFTPHDVSLLDLAMGLTGLWGDGLRSALESSGRRPTPEVDVLEAGLGVTPTQFANISVYNSSVAGLLEAKALEVYDRPEWIGDNFVTNVPTRKRTEKFIGLVESGDEDVTRKPLKPHARASIDERYQTTPETVNRGIAIEVAVESIMFDETGLVMQYCEGVTERVRKRKELAILDLVLGITNNYTYMGTSYNTYVASGGSWVNIVASNPLVDWRDVDEAMQLFADMTDPHNSEPIVITAKQVLVMPQSATSAAMTLTATQYERQAGADGDGQLRMTTGNPILGQFQLMPTSPWLYNRARAATGLNLSEANAKGLWFLGDFKKAFAYMENFPLTITRANPSDYEMADRRIAAAIFLDEMGIPAVMEPRYVVKCKNEA